MVVLIIGGYGLAQPMVDDRSGELLNQQTRDIKNYGSALS
jgi:hypothetical protein